MYEPTFDACLYYDGKLYATLLSEVKGYETAKRELKEVAETLKYKFILQGRKMLSTCTFGGLSKAATPIPEIYRSVYPDALLLHIQNVQWTGRVSKKIVYQLQIHKEETAQK